MRRSGAVSYYATLLRRTYARNAKVKLPISWSKQDCAGLLPFCQPVTSVGLRVLVQEAASRSATQDSIAGSAGNHAYTPLKKGSSEPSAEGPSSSANAKHLACPSGNAVNHAYTPGSIPAATQPKAFSTAIGSSRGVSSSSSSDDDHGTIKAANKARPGKMPSKQAKKGGSSADQSSAPGNHAYPPTAGTSPSPRPASPASSQAGEEACFTYNVHSAGLVTLL